MPAIEHRHWDRNECQQTIDWLGSCDQFFLVRSGLDVNLSSVHHGTETSLIIQGILRAKSEATSCAVSCMETDAISQQVEGDPSSMLHWP
jgi:hypothetical protein